jgi:molybdopterin molybdotransferase
MISLDHARQCVAAAIQPLEPARASLSGALGRILRQDARAPEDMPAFDRSAMDGYAIQSDDASPRFRIVGEVRPGTSPPFMVGHGQCARIFTGAELPAGASQVLKQEDVTATEAWMTPGSRPSVSHIRHRAEDARAGDRLLASGARLGPAEIALLASLGIVEPLVSPLCRTAHFATGDELVDPAGDPGPAHIRDSNSSLVLAFAQAHGGAMVRQQRVADDADLLAKNARLATDAGCDLLLISGGASVGAYDFGRAALDRLGFEVRFDKLNLRPGKPLIFATRGHQAAFVLPGNPLSHLAVLHSVVRVAFERLAGAQPEWRVVNARLREGLRVGGDGRDTLWPARVGFEDGGPVVEALRWRSSGDITGLAGLNAFIRCAVPVLDTGARVPCILLHG